MAFPYLFLIFAVGCLTLFPCLFKKTGQIIDSKYASIRDEIALVTTAVFIGYPPPFLTGTYCAFPDTEASAGVSVDQHGANNSHRYTLLHAVLGTQVFPANAPETSSRRRLCWIAGTMWRRDKLHNWIFGAPVGISRKFPKLMVACVSYGFKLATLLQDSKYAIATVSLHNSSYSHDEVCCRTLADSSCRHKMVSGHTIVKPLDSLQGLYHIRIRISC